MLARILLISFFILFHTPSTLAQENFSSRNPEYISRELEYFYQNHGKFDAAGILASFFHKGWLARSENRLILASFMAELLKEGRLDPIVLENEDLLKEAQTRHCIIWALHLSGLGKKDLSRTREDEILQTQIKATPENLLDWDLNQEKTIPLMYLGSFLASGNTEYIDRIIQTATGNGKSSQISLALLYDYAPRHPVITRRIAQFPNKSGNENLQLILQKANIKSRH